MKVLITGYGRMGRLIERTLLDAGDEIAARIDVSAGRVARDEIIPASQLRAMGRMADVIMDFSHPSLTDELIAYARRTKTPLLSGTTNMSEDQQGALADLGDEIPVIWASNYSLGINLFMHILPQISQVLSGWDVEITETHHNMKVDAPSGTAKTLADAIDPAGTRARVYGREGNCGRRDVREIGIHALRGGTVTGEHRVDFFGRDEIFEITHRASSRQILVDGAIAAARGLIKRPPGYYSMDDILFG